MTEPRAEPQRDQGGFTEDEIRESERICAAAPSGCIEHVELSALEKFCAAARERSTGWPAALAEVRRLQAEVARWKKAVEGLTPSGSEYVDDPEACAAHIRERTNWPRITLEWKARAERAETELGKL